MISAPRAWPTARARDCQFRQRSVFDRNAFVDTLTKARLLASAAGLMAGVPMVCTEELFKRYQRKLFPAFAYLPRSAKAVPVHWRPSGWMAACYLAPHGVTRFRPIYARLGSVCCEPFSREI